MPKPRKPRLTDKVLEDAGLVAQSERGTRNLYCVRVEGFRSVQSFLDSFWDVALGRLEALARVPDKKPGKARS